MCYFIWILTTLVVVSATVPKDICDKCIPKEECQIFGTLNRDDQNEWIKTFSCNEPKQNDYGTPRGFAATAKGDYICCSDKIWGIDSSNKQEHDLDTWNKQTHDDYKLPNVTNKNNLGNDTQDEDQFDYDFNPNQENDDYYDKPSDDSIGNNQNITPNRYPSNIFWNQRPNQKQWNSRNPNFYNSNNYNKNPRYGNDNRNYYNSNQRPGYTSRPRRPNYYNRGTQNNRPHATLNPYFRDNGQGNAFRKFGQCDRITSSPPDPQSGCCGREASDDDRITEYIYTDASNARIDDSAPANIPYYWSNWAPRQDDTYYIEREWPLWPWKDQEQRSKRAYDDKNKTAEVDIENRISGGKDTELYQFPWTVLLITIFDYGIEQKTFSCGGSLISSRYVLTAGHCVYEKEATVKSVQLYLAEYDKRTFPRDCKVSPNRGRECIDNTVLFAENIIRHPQYDDQSLRNDIALIKLRGNAPYTDYIRPICLTSINVDEPDFSNLRLTVAGWGRNGPYKTNVKQSTVVNLVPQIECKKYYPALTTRHVCAAGYTGEDTCKGDSGGPLMTLYRGKYYIVGIVSGKREDAPCGSSVPSLYTNVYHYLDWIRNIAKN